MEGRNEERERNISVCKIHQSVASHTPTTGDMACNACMCPDWESNQGPFSWQASAQSTESHQPGLSGFKLFFFLLFFVFAESSHLFINVNFIFAYESNIDLVKMM